MPSFANHLGLAGHDEATGVVENKSQISGGKGTPNIRLSRPIGRPSVSHTYSNQHNVMMVRYEDLRENAGGVVLEHARALSASSLMRRVYRKRSR